MIRRLGIAFLVCSAIAQAQTPADGMTELRRIYEAGNRLSYTGTFVYQQGDRTETSRITRIAGPGGGEERVEVLDGTPREFIRSRDTVRCYLPESRTVKVERRVGERIFPGMLPDKISELRRHYTITRGESARIAGYDCVAVLLTPKDELRYGYKLWADMASGILLKARTFNPQGETVEQFSFAQLSIGSVPPEGLRSRHRSRDWRIEEAAVSPTNLQRSGWSVGAELPGFRKVTEVSRRLGKVGPVSQLVYSDGMAAVSVFIEPIAGRTQSVNAGASKLGAFHIYTREVANHVITVVGEAPATSVRRIASRVQYRGPQ